MIVLVCGGRDYHSRNRIYDVLDELDRERGIGCIVHGGADGADGHADGWAMSRCRFIKRYPVTAEEWRSFGRRAGPMRNERMLEESRPDLVVAFPGGRGTADMVKRARSAGIGVMKVGE